MKSKKLLCGIDVSKKKLDICYNDRTGRLFTIKVDNDVKGHRELIKKLGRGRTYIMENTGRYSLGLCVRLKKSQNRCTCRKRAGDKTFHTNEHGAA